MDTKIILILLALTPALTQAKTYGQGYDECGMMRANTTERRRRDFSYQIIGSDYENIPVELMNWGKWDVSWLVDQPEELKVFERNYNHSVDEISSDYLKTRFPNQNWTSDSIISIIDFDGLDVRQAFQSKVNKFLLKSLVKLEETAGKVAYGFFINANPFVDQVLSMAKPLTGNFLEKFEVHGTNSKRWLPQIVRKIPRDQLPPYLGGYKDFRPVADCSFL